MADFKTEKGKWTEVQIPFDNFVGSFRGRTLKDEVLDPAKVRRFGLLLADKKSGPFEIDVDWIRAYPEGSTPKSATKGTDLAALLAGDERFKTLVAAASAADLVGVLQGEDNLTVFAPTNEAFAALPKGKVAELLKPENKETLQAILKYHVVGGSNNVAAVLSGKELGTVQGGKVTVGFDEGRVRVNGAAVTDGDLKASNGIVHVIDKVLIPDLPKPKKSTTILGTAEAAGDFKKLAGLVKLAGLTSALEEEGPFTVLAPTDSAFSKLSKETVASLLKKENRGKLQSILKYHVIPGRVTAGDLLNGKSAKTLLGAEVKVQLKDGSLMAGDAKVLTADLECDNGLIHVIDGVLIPSEGSNRTADAEGSQSPADLLNAAIEKGVPIYNGGDHAECAAIYRKCLKELSVDERVSEKTRGMIAQVLDKASSLDSKNAQAWMLRRLMDGLLDRYES